MGFDERGEDGEGDGSVTPVVYSTIAGVPAVTRYVPALVQLTSNSFATRGNSRLIPLSLPRLKFLHGDVADTPEPPAEKPVLTPQPKTVEDKKKLLMEKDRELVSLRDAGMSFAEIGRLKGMTADSIRKAIGRARKRSVRGYGSRRYIMPPNELTPLQQKVFDMKNAGMSFAAIGVEMNRTTNAVAKLFAQAREKKGLV